MATSVKVKIENKCTVLIWCQYIHCRNIAQDFGPDNWPGFSDQTAITNINYWSVFAKVLCSVSMLNTLISDSHWELCRVKLKAATSAVIPQLVIGKPKDSVELQRLAPDNAQCEESETYEFNWQEKVFSQVQIYRFVIIVLFCCYWTWVHRIVTERN